jgi:hypothetical protein
MQIKNARMDVFIVLRKRWPLRSVSLVWRQSRLILRWFDGKAAA